MPRVPVSEFSRLFRNLISLVAEEEEEEEEEDSKSAAAARSGVCPSIPLRTGIASNLRD